MIRRPSRRDLLDTHHHLPLRSELEGIRQQVLENLLQPLRVAREYTRQRVVDLHVEGQILRFGEVMEVAFDGLAEPAKRNLLRFHSDRARLDLRQVENVIDECEQVGSRRMDVLGEVNLLRGQIAAIVFRELLPQDEDRVERRAQLVRHVREEFRLVLRRERQLRGLLFERPPRLLDFLVLALDLRVLLD